MVYRQTENTQRRKQLRRLQMLAAGRKLFAERGYQSTTMNQIVSEAGTSIGNFYFYFSTKEDLLLAIVLEIIEEVWTFADSALEQVNSGIERLAVIFYYSITRMVDDDNLARLLLIGNSTPPVRKAMFEDLKHRVKELVESDPSVFRGGNAELEIYASHGALFALIERKRTGELPGTAHEIGCFIARWNLQALKYSDEDIDGALATIEREFPRSYPRNTVQDVHES